MTSDQKIAQITLVPDTTDQVGCGKNETYSKMASEGFLGNVLCVRLQRGLNHALPDNTQEGTTQRATTSSPSAPQCLVVKGETATTLHARPEGQQAPGSGSGRASC